MAKRKLKKGAAAVRRLITAAVILIILAGIGLGLFKHVYETYLYPIQYEDTVQKYSEEYNVPEALIYAVIKTESGFDPQAVSEVGARGLMQMTEETFEWLQTKTGETDLTFDDLYDTDVSIKYGTLFLSMLLEDFSDDTTTALSAYHAGRASVQSWLQNSDYSADGKTLDTIPKDDTAHYVDKVTKAISIYESRLN